MKKTVLFISPAFFGYEKNIKDAIRENGYEVDYFDERPSNNAFMKALVRVQRKSINFIIEKHFDKISEEIKNKKYDYFFLIKGEAIPAKFILEFKKSNPSAKLIYYTYDSFNNNTNHSYHIQKHFDSCYSIDFRDVENNPSLKLKHLFYSKDFLIENAESMQRPYEISFVGTLHSNRYSVMKSTFELFKNYYLFLYSPAKWWFLYNKLFNKEYKNIKWSTISFNKLNLGEVAYIFRKSQSVLDIQRYGQAGLTMRTFEVLASGSLLITTNQFIKNVDFYDDKHIVILPEDGAITKANIQEIKSKLSVEKTKLQNFEKYYVNNWIKEFFE